MDFNLSGVGEFGEFSELTLLGGMPLAAKFRTENIELFHADLNDKVFFFDFPRAANATHSSVSYSSLSGHYSTTACVCARCSQSATGARYLSAALQRIAFALAQQIKKIVFCVASLTWGGTIVQWVSCSAPFVPRSLFVLRPAPFDPRPRFVPLLPLSLGRPLFSSVI